MSTVRQIIREFAKEEGISTIDVSEAISLIEEIYDLVFQQDVFLAFDALGCCDERTDVQDALYQILSWMFVIQAKATNSKTGELVYDGKNVIG